ncbi:MAG TPA: hypothetical protein VMB72_16635 [Acidimicrobiales bacterium]|nr:hypothetical protein [Acidimicrobiales bacterium]
MGDDGAGHEAFRWGGPPATSPAGGPLGTPGPRAALPRGRRSLRRTGWAVNAAIVLVVSAVIGIRVGEGTHSLAPLAPAGLVLAAVAGLVALVVWGFHRRRRRRRWRRRLLPPPGAMPSAVPLPLPVQMMGMARAVAPVVAGGVVVLGFLPVGRHVADADAARVAIAGAPGYSTVTGPQGLPLAEGQPWGTPCQPVVFGVAAGVPDADYVQLQSVVAEARAAGVDVALETREFQWFPGDVYPAGRTDATVKFVWVTSNDGVPPILAGGHPEHIGFGWDATPDPGGTHERFTDLQATLYLRAVDGPMAVRRAARQLVAFSQAVGATTLGQSGIADGSAVDHFTPADLEAMRVMSGCPAIHGPDAGPPPRTPSP